MRACMAVLALVLSAQGVWAQGLSLGVPVPEIVQSQVLVIDFEKVFAQSAFGQRVATETEAEGQKLAAENRSIESELVDEERRLTEMRASTEPFEFKKLADAFDEKVQNLRKAQDEKARALGSRNESGRLRFVETARPVLAALMQEAGAALILDRRSVFVAADAIDVTAEAIKRIDATIGDGADLPSDGEQQPQQP